jgi:hypothetical protein
MTTIIANEDPHNDTDVLSIGVPYLSNSRGQVSTFILEGEIGDNFVLRNLEDDWDVFRLPVQQNDRLEIRPITTSFRNFYFLAIFDSRGRILTERSQGDNVNPSTIFVFPQAGNYFLVIHGSSVRTLPPLQTSVRLSEFPHLDTRQGDLVSNFHSFNV